MRSLPPDRAAWGRPPCRDDDAVGGGRVILLVKLVDHDLVDDDLFDNIEVLDDGSLQVKICLKDAFTSLGRVSE